MKVVQKSIVVKIAICIILLLNLIKINAQNIDYQILKDLNNVQTTFNTDANKFITNTAPYLSVGTPILMAGVGLLTKNEDLKKKGIETGIACALTVVETYALKQVVKRNRPFITYAGDLNNPDTEGGYSFPSGHSSAAFSVATSLSLNYPKWYVIAPAYLWASATAYSRMYLNVHYPSDVLVGAILGSATAWATWKINKKWQAKKKGLK